MTSLTAKREKLSEKADGTITKNFDAKIYRECLLRNRCLSKNLEKQSRIVIDTKRRRLDERNKLLGLRLTRRYASTGEGLMEKLKPKYLKRKNKV